MDERYAIQAYNGRFLSSLGCHDLVAEVHHFGTANIVAESPVYQDVSLLVYKYDGTGHGGFSLNMISIWMPFVNLCMNYNFKFYNLNLVNILALCIL